MSVAADRVSDVTEAAMTTPLPVVGGVLYRLLRRVCTLLRIVSMLATVAAAAVLSYSVFARYWLRIPTDWEDEASVFLLVGATFLSSAYVQHVRAHIGIEAITVLLPPIVNRIRAIVVDLASFLFCAFFTWKSWVLFYQAWSQDEISDSTWGPPLSIPYGLMLAGMAFLCLEVLSQILLGIAERRGDRS